MIMFPVGNGSQERETGMTYKKKLIEVALPFEAINVATSCYLSSSLSPQQDNLMWRQVYDSDC
jgi:hypothetical protein